MGSTPPYITDAGAPAQGALLRLNTRGATPPVDAYVNPDDSIHFRIWSATANITVTVILRLLLPDGSISSNEWDVIPSSDRVLNSFTFALTEGFILSMAVRPQSNTAGMEVFCNIALLRSSAAINQYTQVLCHGYLTFQDYLTYPNSGLKGSMESPGIIRSITGTTPGAGAEISEVVPAHAIWRVKAFLFKLTTAVAVATRIPHLLVDDGANVFLDSAAVSGQVASRTGAFVTGDDAFQTAIADGTQWLQFVSNLRLFAGSRIRTLTTAIQAADQYTAPQYLVEEWFFQ